MIAGRLQRQARRSQSQAIAHSELAISVEGVSKKFCRDLKKSLFYGVRDVVTDLLGRQRRSGVLRPGEFWALKDIRFQVRRGEAVGLVGANGAGKSTLLRLISGLIKPDTGHISAWGHIAPLIALGAGFNPILTGRENVYANMSILGLSGREIARRFDAVIEFAEIWDAIDAPVQTYSSGMAARLGFACAVYVEPEILLIDEVLSVGDIKFRLKCHERLAQLRKRGTAFILVSHNPYNILNVCTSAIYLTRGRLVMQGRTTDVIRQYEEDLCLGGTEAGTGKLVLPAKSAAESLGLDVRSVAFKDENGEVLEALWMGEPAQLCIECFSRREIANVNVTFVVKTLSGELNHVLQLTSANDKACLKVIPGKVEFRIKLPFCGLVPGLYTARIHLREGVRSFDIVDSFRFSVKAQQMASRCAYYQPRAWEVAYLG